MKPLMVLTLALLPALANAGQITMVNPQEEQTENGKTLCNAGTNSRVTIPRLTGKELKLLLEWLSVLRVTV